jgi:hypothetical protein
VFSARKKNSPRRAKARKLDIYLLCARSSMDAEPRYDPWPPTQLVLECCKKGTCVKSSNVDRCPGNHTSFSSTDVERSPEKGEPMAAALPLAEKSKSLHEKAGVYGEPTFSCEEYH